MILPNRERLKQSANSDVYTAAINALPQTLVGMNGTICGLHLAPIKSAGLLTLKEARLTRHGIATRDALINDRGAILMFEEPGRTEQGEYGWIRLSQREIPQLALVAVKYDPLKNVLTYTAPGMPPLILKETDLYARTQAASLVRMFPTDPELCGVVPLPNGPVSAWFQSFLKGKSAKHPSNRIAVGVRPMDFQRLVPAHHVPAGQEVRTLYTDGDQLLVASRGTLAWLNQGIVAAHGPDFRQIEMVAFRPEIVLGDIPACAEDLIETIEIDTGSGTAELVLTGHCVRCPITQVNQATGTRDDNEPVRWLIKNRPHRIDAAGKPTFAWNAYVPESSLGSIVRLGMSFTVTKERT